MAPPEMRSPGSGKAEAREIVVKEERRSLNTFPLPPMQAGRPLGQAACYAALVHCRLVELLLHIDGAGLEPTEAVVEMVENAGSLADDLLQLADQHGHAEVQRHFAMCVHT